MIVLSLENLNMDLNLIAYFVSWLDILSLQFGNQQKKNLKTVH